MQKIIILCTYDTIYENIKDYLKFSLEVEIVKVQKIEKLNLVIQNNDILIVDLQKFQSELFKLKKIESLYIIGLCEKNKKIDNSLVNNVCIIPIDLVELLAKVELYLNNVSLGNVNISFESFNLLISYENAELINNKENIKINLTKKEASILYKLIDEYPKEVDKLDLLKSIWQFNEITQTKTLESHISNIRRKLYDNNAKIEISWNYKGYKLTKL